MLKIEYEDEALEILITTGKSTDKRYKKFSKNNTFRHDLKIAMTLLRGVSNVKDLLGFGKLHYEKLRGDLSGLSSIRIGYTSKYRLIFEEFDEGIRIRLIEINEHYGDK